jgi:hypothetical protein
MNEAIETTIGYCDFKTLKTVDIKLRDFQYYSNCTNFTFLTS